MDRLTVTNLDLKLARDGGSPCLLHGARDRTPGRGIEEADVAGHVEQRALARQHLIGLHRSRVANRSMPSA